MLKFRPRLWSFGLLGLLMAWAGPRYWTRLQQDKSLAQECEPPPPGMVFVPAGEFLMGSDDATADPDERPLRKVFLPAFCIDRFEGTNRRYREFKAEHRFPPGEDDLPGTLVLKRDAGGFC